MPIKYFNTAWTGVTKSAGWFPKVLLLGLIMLIPVFGPIVVYGYLYGWSRELAWRVDVSLPKRIFENSDGKLYRRGFFALVIAIVFSIIPNIISAISSSVSDQGTLAALCLGLPLALIALVLGLFINLFVWVGIMRMSLYNKLSAGFQVSKIWAMLKHDVNGIMRIFGMYILVMLVACIAIGIVFMVFMLPMVAPMLLVYSTGASVSGAAVVGSALFSGVLMIVLIYVAMCVIVFVEMLLACAIGHWTAQFDVALWRGQDDPMPFETSSL